MSAKKVKNAGWIKWGQVSGSPDVAVDEFSELRRLCSSSSDQERLLLCFRKKTGFTGGSRFVF